MSIFKGTCLLRAGKQFRNVIRSTNDPLPKRYANWLELWWKKCNIDGDEIPCSACANVFLKWLDPARDKRDFVGGHIVLGSSYDVASGAAPPYKCDLFH
jgi:hypothetical protein